MEVIGTDNDSTKNSTNAVPFKSIEEILQPYVETPFRHTKIVDKDNAIKAMMELHAQTSDKVNSLHIEVEVLKKIVAGEKHLRSIAENNYKHYKDLSDDQQKTLSSKDSEISMLNLDLGLADIEVKNTKRILGQCEKALTERENDIKDLSKKLNDALTLLKPDF